MTDEEDQWTRKLRMRSDLLVSIAEKCGNFRKDLKQDILQSANTLSKVFAKMKTQLENKSTENIKLIQMVMKVTEEMERTKGSLTARQVAPSLYHRHHTYSGEAQQMLLSEYGRRRLFSVVLKNDGGKRYRITVKFKHINQSTEQIKSQLKKDINPTNIIAGINKPETLKDGRILIETFSEEEVNSLSRAINTKYGEQLEVMKHKLGKPSLIIYNVPEEITIANVTNVFKAQNPEIGMNEEEFTANFR